MTSLITAIADAIKATKSSARALVGPRVLLKRQVSRDWSKGEPELHFVQLFCCDSGEFLDVGANTGVYSAVAARHAKRVVAMEPNPDVAGTLSSALPSNVEVIVAAASDHSGTASLLIPLQDGKDVSTRGSIEQHANPGFAERRVDISVQTIDSLEFENLTAIKIDVEGHEFAALHGAAEAISRFRPNIIVECEERHNAGGVARLIEFFSARQYSGFFFHRDRLVPIAEFDISRLQSLESVKQLTDAASSKPRPLDYINNFIFLPDDSTALMQQLQSIASDLGRARQQAALPRI
jgi:FkbM family methyltransferase